MLLSLPFLLLSLVRSSSIPTDVEIPPLVRNTLETDPVQYLEDECLAIYQSHANEEQNNLLQNLLSELDLNGHTFLGYLLYDFIANQCELDNINNLPSELIDRIQTLLQQEEGIDLGEEMESLCDALNPKTYYGNKYEAISQVLDAAQLTETKPCFHVMASLCHQDLCLQIGSGFRMNEKRDEMTIDWTYGTSQNPSHVFAKKHVSVQAGIAYRCNPLSQAEAETLEEEKTEDVTHEDTVFVYSATPSVQEKEKEIYQLLFDSQNRFLGIAYSTPLNPSLTDENEEVKEDVIAEEDDRIHVNLDEEVLEEEETKEEETVFWKTSMKHLHMTTLTLNDDTNVKGELELLPVVPKIPERKDALPIEEEEKETERETEEKQDTKTETDTQEESSQKSSSKKHGSTMFWVYMFITLGVLIYMIYRICYGINHQKGEYAPLMINKRHPVDVIYDSDDEYELLP